MLHYHYQSEKTTSICKKFYENGHLIFDIENIEGLNEIKNKIFYFLKKKYLKNLDNTDLDNFFLHTDKYFNPSSINNLRMDVYSFINSQKWFMPTYYSFCKNILDILVGNELAVQNAINLSIVMPKDDGSILKMHADTYTGETPFQVVVWIPLVNVSKSNSLFIASKKDTLKINKIFPKLKNGFNDVEKKLNNKIKFLKINYGQGVIFTPNIFHGSNLNKTKTTRWSFNTRYTGLFTPYSNYEGNEKRLGSFYQPITTKIVSKMGIEFEEPVFL